MPQWRRKYHKSNTYKAWKFKWLHYWAWIGGCAKHMVYEAVGALDYAKVADITTYGSVRPDFLPPGVKLWYKDGTSQYIYMGTLLEATPHEK